MLKILLLLLLFLKNYRLNVCYWNGNMSLSYDWCLISFLIDCDNSEPRTLFEGSVLKGGHIDPTCELPDRKVDVGDFGGIVDTTDTPHTYLEARNNNYFNPNCTKVDLKARFITRNDKIT